MVLSNGDSATIRALTALDYVATGHIPVVTGQDKITFVDTEDIAVPEDGMVKPSDINFKEVAEKATFQFLKGCVAYHTKDGANLKVVDKEDFDCAENEIAITEIDPMIFAEIYNAIVAESAGEEVDLTSFRGEQDTVQDDSPDVSSVGEDSNGTDEGSTV